MSDLNEAREETIRKLLDKAGLDYDGRWGLENLEKFAVQNGITLPIVGGAQVRTVETKPVAPNAEGDDVIRVRTTAPGTFGPGGIAPVGTVRDIKPEAFSENWMVKV